MQSGAIVGWSDLKPRQFIEKDQLAVKLRNTKTEYRNIKIEYHDTESEYRNTAIKYHSNGIEYQVAKIEAIYQDREHIRCSKSGR